MLQQLTKNILSAYAVQLYITNNYFTCIHGNVTVKQLLLVLNNDYNWLNVRFIIWWQGFTARTVTFRKPKARYSLITHRLSEPKQMNGLLKTTTPTATAGNWTLAPRVRVQRSTDCAISAASMPPARHYYYYLLLTLYVITGICYLP